MRPYREIYSLQVRIRSLVLRQRTPPIRMIRFLFLLGARSISGRGVIVLRPQRIGLEVRAPLIPPVLVINSRRREGLSYSLTLLHGRLWDCGLYYGYCMLMRRVVCFTFSIFTHGFYRVAKFW